MYTYTYMYQYVSVCVYLPIYKNQTCNPLV